MHVTGETRPSWRETGVSHTSQLHRPHLSPNSSTDKHRTNNVFVHQARTSISAKQHTIAYSPATHRESEDVFGASVITKLPPSCDSHTHTHTQILQRSAKVASCERRITFASCPASPKTMHAHDRRYHLLVRQQYANVLCVSRGQRVSPTRSVRAMPIIERTRQPLAIAFRFAKLCLIL